jgi:DNA-binding response OmpR family regulator
MPVKIVLAAENGFMRTSVQVNLLAAGYEVTGVVPSCLYDVLVCLREVLPRLVILDHDIPRCNCETVVRIIREDPVLAGTPVLVILERWESEGVERMSRWHKVGFLQKPLQVDALILAVQDGPPPLRNVS